MLHAYLIALAALDNGVLVVQVVELQLHELQLRVQAEDAVQHFGLVVEGHAEVAHLSLALELGDYLKGAAALVVLITLCAHGVEQIVVEIPGASAAQLLFKERQHVVAGLEKARGELVRQDKALARIPRYEAVTQRELALAVEVAMGSVEIGETGGEKLVYHLTELRLVYLAVDHGQAHCAEAEAFQI